MKGDADVYTVRVDGEWGRFYVMEGTRQGPDRGYHWCEVVCHTTFGTFGYTWNSIGQPGALGFLRDLSYDYAMGKFMGLGTKVWDEEHAANVLREFIVRQRRECTLSMLDARDAWDDIYEEGMAETDINRWLGDHIELYNLGAWELDFKVDNPQARGFWNHLWPAFLAALGSAEVETQTPAELPETEGP